MMAMSNLLRLRNALLVTGMLLGLGAADPALAAKRVFEMNIEDTRITLVEKQQFHTFAFAGQVPGPLFYVDEGDDLVMNGCVKAARDGKMLAVPYDGFWAPMDTLKERNALEDGYHQGIRPWALWLDDSARQPS